MGEVRLSRLAQSDLAEIWLLIASDKGPATADHWIDRIEARCGQLAQFPESGPARPDIADGARMLVISRWLVLYEMMAACASCASSMPRGLLGSWICPANRRIADRHSG
ncbi:type II toxin-antitoxin system RelE/ParE family toxin [Bradyrhizobium pachyrhizi]|uniref:type II toxin-antitoxin system RelE/ParE family toxin n=1 Tax=Bradyrhizobium pachyrhizi TaxID=280333 RepID=UPI001FD3489A|nr:type II toxin-antitoxin system RelE/ParE family toxin [Bradyrhizobium pachyrhizi]